VDAKVKRFVEILKDQVGKELDAIARELDIESSRVG
jgi:hypothetical protein